MAVIYPSSIRGLTAGALRQVNQQGFSTAQGGLWRSDYVKNMALTDPARFLDPREPTGIFMTALKQAKVEIDEMSDAMSKARFKMVEEAKLASEQLTDASRKMREGTEKLGAAIQKFSNICGTVDFAEKAKAAESLANSLERLAQLDQNGMLSRVIQALQK